MQAPERRMISVPRVVLAFALAGLVAVLAAGAVADRAFRSVGRDEAVLDARKLTDLAASAVVRPRLTAALLAGKPAAVARLDAAIRRSVLGGEVVRVKLWSADGRIVYSDAVALRGLRFPAHGAEIKAQRDGVVTTELSNLDAPENRYERRFHKLLEVYLPVRGPHGERLLFESYQRFTAIEASGRRLRAELLPPFAIVLGLLWLIQIPLAVSMARRLRTRQRERERLLGRAIDASNEERRRIARDLHDGPVQTLAGVAYGLSAAAERTVAGDPAGGTFERAAGALRDTIRELRSLLVVVHPPSLQRSGLQAALDDAAAPLRGDGVAVDVAVDGERLGPKTEVLVFRAAQEALRNARSHAAAGHVTVHVEGASGVARLRVTDDGRGFDAAAAPPDDHLGLELLAGLVREAGGRLDVDSDAGSGTTVRVEVPA